MKPAYLSPESIQEFISNALAEDVGNGDHSTLASIPKEAKNEAYALMKADGVIAGMEMASIIFKTLEPEMKVELLVNDGDQVKKGDIIFRVFGSSRAILTAERLVLNCMQRMSGIATHTHHLANLIDGTGARLLDTRKTTPNFRIMEKWAVLIGGGVNHRFGLYDMVMLKDNHVDFAGSITKAVANTVEYLESAELKLKIEVETRTLEEVQEALDTGKVDRIMLDNMSLDMMRKAVTLIGSRSETEASGGITEATIRAVAETGVDYISVGALTHSSKSLDISLKAK